MQWPAKIKETDMNKTTPEQNKALVLEAFDTLFNSVIPDGERSATLVAKDGVVELPFLHVIGIPTRYQGHVAIREFFNFVGGTLYPDFGFKPEDINVLIETPEQVFAEYTAHTTATRTGRILHHLFAGRLVAKKGQDHATP
jgi:uncharacterized protein